METALTADEYAHHMTKNGKTTLCGETVSRVVPEPEHAIVLCRPCINEMVGRSVRAMNKETR